jgi:hypothetical protein
MSETCTVWTYCVASQRVTSGSLYKILTQVLHLFFKFELQSLRNINYFLGTMSALMYDIYPSLRTSNGEILENINFRFMQVVLHSKT